MIPKFKTMRLSRVSKPFDSPDWIFELKHDGFRSLAYIDQGRCQLISRRNLAYRSFDNLKAALAKLRVKDAVLDGELVCLDASGRSIFNQILYRRSEPTFYAFDLLWLNGKDLRQLPLWKRKQRLERLVMSARIPELLNAHHIEEHGAQLFAAICAQNLEGIVAKAEGFRVLVCGAEELDQNQEF